MKRSGDKLLASDMDGTVIPLDKKRKRKVEIKEFNKLISQHKKVKLAYVTGRHLSLALAGVKKFNLPMPNIFICDVGTSIYFRKDNKWCLDQGYKNKLKNAWKGHDRYAIAMFLYGIDRLKEQELEKQNEFKQSYYMDLKFDKSLVIKKIKSTLNVHGIKAKIIYSVDTKKKIGLIDVLPAIASKDYALEFLMKRLNLARKNIVYAGDSGNDMDAFLSGFNVIIVANTRYNIKDEVGIKAKRKGTFKKIYYSTKKYVLGVIEGCYHYNIFKGG